MTRQTSFVAPGSDRWVWCGLTLALLLSASVAAGCRGPASSVELRSFRDPYFPEPYQLDLPGCVYRLDAGRDIHVAGKTHSADGPHGSVTQYLHVHIYWKPNPGKTPADDSTSNALVRYVVVTPKGAAEYLGTGFAYPAGKPGKRLTVKLESVYLRPELVEGEVPDLLGQTHLSGQLVANCQPTAAAQLIRESELLRAH